MAHPNPDRRHVMTIYRRYILGEKRKAAGRDPRAFRRGARSLIHYRDYVAEYLAAKRDLLKSSSPKSSEKAILGALKSAIDAHGPITLENYTSAMKRVWGAVRAYERERFASEDEVDSRRPHKAVVADSSSAAGTK